MYVGLVGIFRRLNRKHYSYYSIRYTYGNMWSYNWSRVSLSN